MSRTIEELQGEIDELEKRIKAISNAQTLHQQLQALDSYFNSISEYLGDIQQLLEDANTEHTTITSALSTLSSTVNTLGTRVTALENADTQVDLSEIETAISNLGTQISNLKDGSTATIADLQSDISDIQTDLGALQDGVDDMQDDISDINTDIGAMQTSINTLTSAQSSLSSAQSSLTSTVSGINSRLTSVESSVTSLTGGVDLSAFQNQLNEHDAITTWNQNYFRYIFNVNCSPENNYLYLNELKFSSNIYTPITIKVKLNYTSTASSGYATFMATANSYLNIINQQIDYSANKTVLEATSTYLLNNKFHEIKFSINSYSNINVSSLEVEVYGSGVMQYGVNRDIEAMCCDDKIVVLKRESNGISYKLYDRTELNNISFYGFNNLISNYDSTEQKNYIKYDIAPYGYSQNNTMQELMFGLIKTTPDLVSTIEPLQIYTGSNTFFNKKTLSNVAFGFKLAGTMYSEPKLFSIQAGTTDARMTFSDYSSPSGRASFALTNMSFNKYWFWCRPIENNYIKANSSLISSNLQLKVLALFQDGYIYFVDGILANPLKLKKGLFATGYMQEDGSINIYVSNYYSTTKYKLTINSSTNKYEISSTTEISDYNVVYELYDNKAIGQKLFGTWQVFNTTF